MRGAEALVRTLVDHGVDVCFANPGTSEMHVVAALDTVGGLRGVLALAEGVATGAADGYARIADRPAAVLLHLGPGLGNGLANLHNARRAGVPLLAVIGDHATSHKRYDAPLESDIDAVAGTVAGWVRRTGRPRDIGADAAAAVAAAATGAVAALILPADVCWSDGAEPAGPAVAASPAHPDDAAVRTAATALRSGDPAVLLIGGDATREPGLSAAARIAAATGAQLLCETFPARLQRGAGLPPVERLGYFAEAAAAQLAGVRRLVLAGARSPVSFFAYPGRPSDLVPEGCDVHVLAARGAATAALTALADEVARGVAAPLAPARRPALPTGPLTAAAIADAVGALLPERAIVVDESNTAGLALPAATAGAPQHDWLTLTGGAIGYGLPAAVGAAIAAPDRPVLALQADGSAMYTLPALWTQARERLDVTTVLYDNRSYDILRVELARVGASGGERANALFDLGRPDLDFVRLAEGMGVPARRAVTANEFVDALRAALAEPGPHLIDAVIPSMMG
ncbi:acetolactate synthase large subunit [Mycobacterium sp. MYCO198283]|uniref:acetolactate synthase large subunit n=1 Tax=Mycobacterium sp. MYCO198283 TaxID=2883505 RepID=UPI001E2D4691|nr:acetolactate synthase large subunit [Mycobacterium sp. MYCO198283]MCG5433226.1 acetolactate synthase large subunit [Mycobacterium sp. MYCO198283]